LFVQTKNEIDEITPIMNQKLKGAGTVWFAYPKRSSKKYTSEISRDYGWEILGEFEFQAVRSFAVDQD